MADTASQGAKTIAHNGKYNSTFSSRGALLSDVKTVFKTLEGGREIAQIRRLVIEDNLLDRGTRQNRENMWKEFTRRYISGRAPQEIASLSRMIARCADSTAVDLILLYEYCQADSLLYDLTAYCTYDLYQNARTLITQLDVDDWLKKQESRHPEIREWSSTTRSRVIRSYLATIRDFGLVKGIKQKEFYKLYVPREAFLYALYHQKDRGLTGKAVVNAIDWRLFLMSDSEVIFMLEDAAKGGFIHFRQAGKIYDLRFVYRDLHEVVDVIVGG